MKRASWGIVCGLGLLGLIGIFPPPRTTTAGRLVRFLRGETGGQQAANDLADTLTTKPGAAVLRRWVDDVLATHPQEGAFTPTTIPVPGSWPIAAVCRPKDGAPYLRLERDFLGIYAGAATFSSPPPEWYLRRVAPGIWVYFREH